MEDIPDEFIPSLLYPSASQTILVKDQVFFSVNFHLFETDTSAKYNKNTEAMLTWY